MDEYEQWLRERVQYYTDWLLEYTHPDIRPDNLRWDEDLMRYSLECYEMALEKYLEAIQHEIKTIEGDVNHE